MKKILLSLATVLCASAFASAAEVTYQHVFATDELKTAGGEVTLTDVTWTTTAAGYIGFDSTNGKGVQIGKSKAPATSYTLSTSAFSTNTIKSITVNSSIAASGDAALTVKVGDTAVIDGQALTTTATDYTASDLSLTGDISISWTCTAKAYYIKSISITYEVTGVVVDAPQFSVEGGKYFEAQTVEITAGAGSTIYYTTDGATPTDDVTDGSSIKYTEPITISTTTTLKAIAFDADDNKSNVTTATYTIAKLLEGAEGEGTEANPFNVAAAHNAANQGSTATVYVKGYITKIDEVNTSFGNATYSINDDATYDAASALVIFRCYYGNDGTNNIKFTDANQIAEGNLVVVYGKLKDYNGTMELEKGYIVTLDGRTTGVEAIENDANAPVEYFNLQGVRVDNPAKGLYIMRQGSKVVKVVK